jgi:hypothetical protein
MANERHRDLKRRIAPYRAALYDFDFDTALGIFKTLNAPIVNLRMCSPFGTFKDPTAFFEATYGPLNQAIPDLECRDSIRVAGRSQDGHDWVGIMGTAFGVFKQPFLDIRPTIHLVHMRYHEFYRFDGDHIVEMQAIWDIPELMMQAGVWPMVPSLGREFHIPGPAAGDGISDELCAQDQSDTSLKIVIDMLEQMKDYPAKGGAETMHLGQYWHPKMS